MFVFPSTEEIDLIPSFSPSLINCLPLQLNLSHGRTITGTHIVRPLQRRLCKCYLRLLKFKAITGLYLLSVSKITKVLTPLQLTGTQTRRCFCKSFTEYKSNAGVIIFKKMTFVLESVIKERGPRITKDTYKKKEEPFLGLKGEKITCCGWSIFIVC